MKSNQTLKTLQASLKILEEYVSKNYRTQLFIEENCLVIFLSKGKIPSQKTIKALETFNWEYNKEFGCFCFTTLETVELLTSSCKKTREQAQRYSQRKQALKKKNGRFF